MEVEAAKLIGAGLATIALVLGKIVVVLSIIRILI